MEISWADSQPSAITLSEDSVAVPMLTVRRIGLSAVDTVVKVVPRGITATGNRTHWITSIADYNLLSPFPLLAAAENVDFMVNDNRIVIPASNRNSILTGRNFISMTLLDDLAVEGNETMELVIESVDAERIMVQNSPRPTLLTITDNDCKCVWANPPPGEYIGTDSQLRVQ